MTQAMIYRLSEKERYLVTQAMGMMDSLYDESMGLLCSEEDNGRHNTRSSAHYAVGLLTRRNPGDRERAIKVLNKVLDLQFDCPAEIYHGTFRVSPQAQLPPEGNYDWKTFAPGFTYFLNQTIEKVGKQLGSRLSLEAKGCWLALGEHDVREHLREAVDQVLPPVWKSYDPNWREFIACTFAVILHHFEIDLPQLLIKRMDSAMIKAVGASIDRRLSDAIPMNSNIELMHIFIVHYYGYRYTNNWWIEHAEREANSCLEAYQEFGSLAEFNSTTYYGVDLTVLAMWRVYGKSTSIIETGRMLEYGLWENIAQFYNPDLQNISGPFSRAYEMEMSGHSSIGVFLYLALGDGYRHLADISYETSHDTLIALLGVNLPAELLPQFIAHSTDRKVEKQFRELCERDDPKANTNLCKASAWIERERMIGAMSGSKNTNGQMHPATIHWKNNEGDKCYLRLLRREKGKSWNTHLRGILFEANVDKDQLSVEIQLHTDVEVEVYFEVSGPGLISAEVNPDLWVLPGMTCRVASIAPKPVINWNRDSKLLEVIYLYSPKNGSAQMNFTLSLDPLDP